jgi:endogenous inhibitor of DNA gyrase (YacG/DUF329 family)
VAFLEGVIPAVRCPICEREFDPAAPDAVKPFCSARCRTIDLGRWLGEGYAFPAARPRGESEDEAAEGADF